MKLGFIGLGKMGGRMVERLIDHGHEVLVFDREDTAIKNAQQKGAHPAASISELVQQLPVPKIVWCMVPSGEVTKTVLAEVSDSLAPGDIIIDGGNSNYKQSIKTASDLASRGIRMLDAGTSGGIWGLTEGYCLMVGGDKEAYLAAEPIFASLAPSEGYGWMGPSGAGHFVKMIHNGIEYALMQAYGEGFELLTQKTEFNLDPEKIAGIWNQGSVIRSWLLELTQNAFRKDPGLKGVKGYVEDSGEGRWTVKEAIDLDTPAPAITLSLLTRMASRQKDSFSNKVIAALRNEFGGHGFQATESESS